MPGCPYFIGNTFAHLVGGLLVTGISTENPIVDGIEKKPMTHLSLIIFTFFLLFALLYTENGPFKYFLFAMLCITFGQTLTGFTKRLQQENLLANTLIIVGTIFVSMATIGLFDKGNMLSWEVYLSAALFGLIIAMVVTSLLTKTKKDADIVHLWISRIIVVLFTLYLGFDVEILKVNATLCKSKPDYINESLNIYLDVLNLFIGVGGAQQ
jgi:FtsH-binding integral membrane protein